MQRSITLSIGVLALASVAAINLAGSPAPAPTGASSYSAKLAGAVSAAAAGRARYGSPSTSGTPEVFTVSLVGRGSTGSILFTRVGGGRMAPGTYLITDGESDGVRALVTTGSVEHPTGAFRAEAGVLTITGFTGGVLTGEFRMRATGFLASDPADESKRLTVSGAFSATPSAAR